VAKAEAIRGPVDVADLGPTPMLEHVFVLSAGYVASRWDKEARVAAARLHAREELAHPYALRCPGLLLPALHEAGVTGARTGQMLADNPRGRFSGSAS
jgi:predicted metal-dependent phosphotriesterase family hydrolase